MPFRQPMGVYSRRQFIVASGAALGTSACGLPKPARATPADAADLIIVDANIVTQDLARPRAEAIAVRGGLIQAVGTNSDISSLRGASTQYLSGEGRTLIPGLNDSHIHPTRAGRFYASELRWDGVGSLARGIEMIRQAAAVTPEGQWVRVIGGWSPFQFEEKRLPTPGELTEAAPATPVYVLFLYSQGYLNRRAVEILNLSSSTRAPAGTRYEFTPDGGCILHAEPNPDLLYGAIAALPALTEAEQVLSSRHFYRELNRFGITSVIDAGGGGHSFPVDYRATDSLAEDGDLGVRISAYLFPQRKGDELQEFERWTREWQVGVNRAEMIMNAYVLRGGGEFLVWSAGDYENFMSDRPDITTRANWRPQLLGVTRHLLQNRWPIRIHATYDQSMRHILDVFEEAHALEVADGRSGFAGIRWAFDHGETVTPETLRRIKALGGGLAVQARMAYAGEYFMDRYGEEATRNTPPLRSILNSGVPMGLGTDGTRVASYNPWPAFYWAVSGRSVGGTQLHGPDNWLSRQEALFAYSVGSAWFSQEEHLKGRLMPGQFADFALLNADIFKIEASDLKSVEAELTVMNGRPVYASGDYAGLTPALPPIAPEWSPVRYFGGFQRNG